MKTTLKNRIWALVLVFAMLAPMFPVMHTHVHAADATGTLSVTGLSVTYEMLAGNKSSCDLEGTKITATAQSKSGIGSSNRVAGKTKVTFTNTGSSTATLSFSYTGSSVASLTVDGVAYNTSGGSVTKALAATTGTLVIEFTSDTGTLTSKKTATLTITDVALATEKNVTVTFKAPVNGSYTIDSTTVGAPGYTATKKSTESFAAVATAASGYAFFGWYNETTGTYLSYKASDSLTVTDDATVYPEFIPNTTALFDVGGVTFYDLTKAGQYAASGAVKTIVLTNNGTVSGNHTIPAGVTLLVPFNSSNTLYRNEPECTSGFLNNAAWVEPTAYRTLTLAADANITVNGAISISGQHAASNGGKPYCGAPTGPVGWVKMLSGSQITLNSGANLYAWGFIQGAGNITAKNGATIYENFQFTDFRGGSNLTQIVGDGLVFPINQYYVQNIEVPTRYEAGAKETLYTSAYASAMTMGGEAPFIGQGGMFVVNDGYIVKDYIENKDRMQVDIYGDVTMSSMTVEVSVKVDSSNYILPITNNITINMHSGTTSLGQSVALLPGVEMTIDKDATLVIGSNSKEMLNDYNTGGYHLVVYDSDEWFYGLDKDTSDIVEGVQYAFGGTIKGMYPLPFAPGRTYNRTAADLKDAVLNVNGEIVVEGGLYTTLGGAAIKSSDGTGTIVMNSGAGPDFVTFQANGGTSLMIPMNSAALMNGDGSYVYTGPTLEDDTIPAVEPGTNFRYCNVHDCWYAGMEGECEKCNVPSIYEITWIINGEQITVEVEEGTVPSYNGTPIKTPDASGHYIFAGWATTENGTVLTTLPAVTGNATYYAVFTAEAHNDDKIEGGKHYCTVCNYTIGSCADTDKNHKCDVGGEDYACHQGTLTTQNGQAATCGADGWNAYYQCSCGKIYANADATGTAYANLDAWKVSNDGKIPATGNHIPNEDDGDCTTDVTCSVCGTVTTEGNASHDSSYVNNGDGTHDYVCSICQTVEKDNEKHTYENGSCVCGAEERLKGDVDLDGDVDFEDAVLLTRYTMDVEDIENETALANGDVNGDGNVDFEDAVKLTRYTMGLETLD